MTATIAETAQQVSDDFHAMTAQSDQMLFDLSSQLQALLKVRNETGMTGIESQRPIKHLTAAILNATEMRGSIALAHSAAEKEAEKASIPWDCVNKAEADEPPVLSLVK